jgi:hypothetical protein
LSEEKAFLKRIVKFFDPKKKEQIPFMDFSNFVTHIFTEPGSQLTNIHSLTNSEHDQTEAFLLAKELKRRLQTCIYK